ncbi:MAG: D-alanyl-D-alanine carboxypeptidase [Herbiconiux sp.]|uniref:D-alanyl-D-alanine carboxypeptidase family protein n=1 Tax=Herbiconiux sp. TaxID=1871186 RepID=UPI0012004C62|nr:hypothetical protein [Herbiconiux sp.]TAJ49402.1 MAG: D-alanyl-D-alanine carboxypeptidase [Herbiconiux sp.]
MRSSRWTRPSRLTLGIAVVAVAVTVTVTGCTAPSASGGAAAPTAATQTATAVPTDVVIPAGTPAVLQFPQVGSGAVGIAHPDGSVDVLGQGGETGTVPIASITKVITALVVLDAHPLTDTPESLAAGTVDQGPTITLGQADLDITAAVEAQDQFVEPMYAGQEVSLRDALAITLLTSANNYAESVALWAFGSQEGYLTAARAWLAEQGLTATTLADASGLDPGSASSTGDLLRVASLAHANPALASIAGLTSLDQADLGTIVNQNVLLGENGVDGLKTGSTSYAGYTLLTSAQVVVGATPVTLVSVVLGTSSIDDRFATTRALLASAQAGLREVPLVAAGQALGTYTVPAEAGSDAAPVQLVASASGAVSAVVFGDEPVTTTIALDELTSSDGTLSAAIGDVVGTATFTTSSGVHTVPLALSGS